MISMMSVKLSKHVSRESHVSLCLTDRSLVRGIQVGGLDGVYSAGSCAVPFLGGIGTVCLDDMRELH